MKYHNPVNILNHIGARQKLVNDCNGLTVLVFCSQSGLDRYKNDVILRDFLTSPSVLCESNFESNPSLVDLEDIARRYADIVIDVIVGLGGGSSMDAAKVSSVSIPAFRSGYSIQKLLDDHSILESISAIKTFQVPTTAGTGSEVTPFATVWDYELALKKSLTSGSMYATTAYVDAEFLQEIPVETALATGLDALNQGLESIWNRNANHITRSIAIEGVSLNLCALPKIDDLKSDIVIAQNLASASLLAGIAISQTRTAICHSMSYPLTLRFGLPHGLACAFTMIAVYKHNFDSIKKEIHSISSNLGGINPLMIIEEVFERYDYYHILRRYIPSQLSVMELRDEMSTLGRADNNIVDISDSDLTSILEHSCAQAAIK
jgi:alcohol dehydrogenase